MEHIRETTVTVCIDTNHRTIRKEFQIHNQEDIEEMVEFLEDTIESIAEG